LIIYYYAYLLELSDGLFCTYGDYEEISMCITNRDISRLTVNVIYFGRIRKEHHWYYNVWCYF